MLTNAQMQAILAAGSSILYRGTTITDPSLLPTDAQIAIDFNTAVAAATPIMVTVVSPPQTISLGPTQDQVVQLLADIRKELMLHNNFFIPSVNQAVDVDNERNNSDFDSPY